MSISIAILTMNCFVAEFQDVGLKFMSLPLIGMAMFLLLVSNGAAPSSN